MKVYYIVFSLVGLLSFFGIFREYKKADQARKEQVQEQAELSEKLRLQYAKVAYEKIERENQEREHLREMEKNVREAELKLNEVNRKIEMQRQIMDSSR
jgi:hypothetical protein